jgi:hypothetical protein
MFNFEKGNEHIIFLKKELCISHSSNFSNVASFKSPHILNYLHLY